MKVIIFACLLAVASAGVVNHAAPIAYSAIPQSISYSNSYNAPLLRSAPIYSSAPLAYNSVAPLAYNSAAPLAYNSAAIAPLAYNSVAPLAYNAQPLAYNAAISPLAYNGISPLAYNSLPGISPYAASPYLRSPYVRSYLY